MLDVLDLFTAASPLLSAERIVEQSGASPATIYRYVADLCAAGLLKRQSGSYALGYRIAELDHLLRRTDPLLAAALPVMRQMREHTGLEVLLFEMVGERLIATHRETGVQPAGLVFERGCPASLLLGAPARAILSGLPMSRLRKLQRTHAVAISEAGLGSDWTNFHQTMAATRRARHAVSVGEIDPDAVSVAAPISRPRGATPGCVAALMHLAQWQAADRATVANHVMEAARQISTALTALT